MLKWRLQGLPGQAIAWGQAMFLGGGNVIPVDAAALGLVVLGCGPVVLGLGLVLEKIKEASTLEGGHGTEMN